MTVRERIEAAQDAALSPLACRAAESRGREVPEPECSVRTCFQRDIDRIVHSKSFRRLKHKTQVFLQPEGDHYRTRMTHTIEVVRIARTIARGLFLNEDLTEAVAFGHDLGHTPFGHAGERVARRDHARRLQPLRAEPARGGRAGKNGAGLNSHLGGSKRHPLPHEGLMEAATLEGRIVRLADVSPTSTMPSTTPSAPHPSR
jgi:dGTPase